MEDRKHSPSMESFGEDSMGRRVQEPPTRRLKDEFIFRGVQESLTKVSSPRNRNKLKEPLITSKNREENNKRLREDGKITPRKQMTPSSWRLEFSFPRLVVIFVLLSSRPRNLLFTRPKASTFSLLQLKDIKRLMVYERKRKG